MFIHLIKIKIAMSAKKHRKNKGYYCFKGKNVRKKMIDGKKMVMLKKKTGS